MTESVHAFLENQPVMVVCIVLAFGYLIGRIRFKGFELGSVTGVLFAGLVFGHLGFSGHAVLQSLGFAMFMYVVGFEAGPRVFSVLRTDGLKYLVLTLVIAAAGFVTALALGRALDLPPGSVAGALAGGMTTTPTLAAAQDAVQSGQVTLPEGLTADRVIANITSGYAITYLVGLIGLILVIKIVPRVLGLDLEDAAKALESDRVAPTRAAGHQVTTRAYRVTEDSPIVGMTLREAEATVPGEARCGRIRRNGTLLDPDDPELRIEAGDDLTVVGRVRQLKTATEGIGPEIDDPEMLALEPESAQVVVTRRLADAETLHGLGVTSDYGCVVNHVSRAGVELEPNPSLEIQRGDVIAVTAPEPYLQRLGAHLGHLERDIAETDLLTMMTGVAVGIGIGAITITIAGVPIGLGVAGGVLLTGILLGLLRSVHPTFGRVPSGARWFIMEIGLLLFMSGVGLAAGSTILETLRTAGLPLILTGFVVMLVPVLAGIIVGRFLFRMNLALLFGAITGAMTSTAAMRVVCAEARSSLPALGYTGAYALANVILAIAGYLIIRFEM